MVKVAVKLLIALFLLSFVLYSIEFDKLIQILKKVDIFWIFVAFLFFNISKVVSAFRLNYYFSEINIKLPSLSNLKLYYIGMFYNLFLPGGVGGDGYKAYILHKKYKQKLSLVIQALLFDRISGLIGLIFLASLLFIFSKFAIYPLNILSTVSLILVYPLFFFMSIKLKKFTKFLNKTTILGLVVQIIQLICAFFIILSLDTQIPIIDFLVLFLISSVVSVAPITIGGVGVREVTFLYGLNFLGYEPNSGVAFSFLFFLITFLSSLIGILFIWNKKLYTHPS